MVSDSEQLKSLLDSVTDGVYFVDGERRITFWNQAAERLTGFRSEQVLGRSCSEGILCHVDEEGTGLCEAGCPLTGALSDAENGDAEVYLRHARGHRVPVRLRCSPLRSEDGTVIGAAQIFTESSRREDALRRVQELEEIAFLDPLTRVGNRRYAEMMLAARLQEGERYGRWFGVIFLDLDRFKSINDTYGHKIGDRALELVARTLAANQRGFDICARWGGEEFVLILMDVEERRLGQIAGRCCALIRSSVIPDLEDPPILTVSAGVTLARKGDTVHGVVDRADRLMYESKRAGGDGVTQG